MAMNSRNRTLALILVVASLGAGLLYTNVVAPWLATAPPTPSAKSRSNPRGKKGIVAAAPTKADEKIEPSTTPPKDLPPPAPDPAPFAYRGQLFDKLDRDRDRYLDESEIPAAHREAMMKHDRDGNGRIDVVEFDAALDSLDLPLASPRLLPRQSLLTPPDPKVGIPVYVPKTDSKSDLPDWFRERDKDGDRQIGLYEWPAGGIEEFRRLDSNQDGFITVDEALKERDLKQAKPR